MSSAPMAVWALTGPAGAGKSAVSEILRRAGAVVIDGDRLGHELLSRPEIQARIVSEIGPGYVQDGEVDRAALGALVFADPGALAGLNTIMHGPLSALATEKLDILAAAGEHELAVFEAAVYFLLPSPLAVDLVVAVVAPVEQRLQRLVARSGGALSAEDARRRLEAQENLEAHWARADEIIVNDGTLDELEARTLRIWPRGKPGRETQP